MAVYAATGKRYGLEVNSLIDERRDPVKASYAAAHYLSDLYKIFDDWSLVIAAYNCGPTNVNKAIHRAKGNATTGTSIHICQRKHVDMYQLSLLPTTS